MALDAKRDRLFLANTANGTLDVIDLKAGKLLKQVAGQSGIQGVAYAADLDRVFVGLGTGGYCNVFDGGRLQAAQDDQVRRRRRQRAIRSGPIADVSSPTPRRRWA